MVGIYGIGSDAGCERISDNWFDVEGPDIGVDDVAVTIASDVEMFAAVAVVGEVAVAV